jgi:hypothetical protein
MLLANLRGIPYCLYTRHILYRHRLLEFNDLISYLLLGALSPVLHVEGSRTRSFVGANISSFCHHFSLLWPSTYHFPHLLHCDSSLLFSSSLLVVLFTVYHCYSSLGFITTFCHCFSSLLCAVASSLSSSWLSRPLLRDFQ